MTTRPIPLTDYDLRQMSDACVSALTPARKNELLVRALFELRKSRDRLNQMPSNSSNPPSSRAPWESTCADDAASVLTAPTTKPIVAPAPTDDDDMPQGGTKTLGPGPKSSSGKPKEKKLASKSTPWDVAAPRILPRRTLSSILASSVPAAATTWRAMPSCRTRAGMKLTLLRKTPFRPGFACRSHGTRCTLELARAGTRRAPRITSRSMTLSGTRSRLGNVQVLSGQEINDQRRVA